MAILKARPSGWQADPNDPGSPASLPQYVEGDESTLEHWKTPLGYVKVVLGGVDVDPGTVVVMKGLGLMPMRLDFDPSEPRDDTGKWTSSGASTPSTTTPDLIHDAIPDGHHPTDLSRIPGVATITDMSEYDSIGKHQDKVGVTYSKAEADSAGEDEKSEGFPDWPSSPAPLRVQTKQDINTATTNDIMKMSKTDPELKKYLDHNAEVNGYGRTWNVENGDAVSDVGKGAWADAVGAKFDGEAYSHALSKSMKDTEAFFTPWDKAVVDQRTNHPDDIFVQPMKTFNSADKSDVRINLKRLFTDPTLLEDYSLRSLAYGLGVGFMSNKSGDKIGESQNGQIGFMTTGNITGAHGWSLDQESTMDSREQLLPKIWQAVGQMVKEHPGLPSWDTLPKPPKESDFTTPAAPVPKDPAKIAAAVLTRRYINTWASSSGDSEHTSIMLQIAARHVFGIPKPALNALKDYAGTTYDAAESAYQNGVDGPPEKPFLDAFVKSVYNRTQATLKKAGVKEVVMYRGMGFASIPPSWAYPNIASAQEKRRYIGTLQDNGIAVEYKVGHGQRDASLSPLSSWSFSPEVATRFAPGMNPVIMSAKVPASRVWSLSASTGPGCLEEREGILVGGDVGKVTVAWNSHGPKEGDISGWDNTVSAVNENFKQAMEAQGIKLGEDATPEQRVHISMLNPGDKLTYLHPLDHHVIGESTVTKVEDGTVHVDNGGNKDLASSFKPADGYLDPAQVTVTPKAPDIAAWFKPNPIPALTSSAPAIDKAKWWINEHSGNKSWPLPGGLKPVHVLYYFMNPEHKNQSPDTVPPIHIKHEWNDSHPDKKIVNEKITTPVPGTYPHGDDYDSTEDNWYGDKDIAKSFSHPASMHLDADPLHADWIKAHASDITSSGTTISPNMYPHPCLLPMRLDFDPSEARDDAGKWTSDGGAALKSFDSTWRSSITPAQVNAVNDYRGYGYARINEPLRDPDGFEHNLTRWKNPDIAASERQKILTSVSSLKTLMRPVTVPLTVYRGMGKEMFTGTDEGLVNQKYDWKTAVGKTFTDKGFVSTALKKSTAENFDFKGAVAELHLPAGISGAPLQGIKTKPTNPDDLWDNAPANDALDEQEFLLEPGLHYKVTSATMENGPIGQRAHLVIEVSKDEH